MRNKAVLIAAALAVAAAGYLAYSKMSAGPGINYVTEQVRRGDLSSYVSATGKVNPKVSVLVGTEVSGTIREIFVDNNSVVKKGQVLVKLDPELIQAQVEQAAARLASAEASLKELESSRGLKRSEVKTAIDEKKALAQKASADAERKKLLFKSGVIAREELDDALSAEAVAMAQYQQAQANEGNYEVIDAQIEAARAAVREAKAGLSTARTNLSKAVITAPMDGVVINKNVEVGQTVAASFSTPELLDIGDLTVMEIEVSVDEADMGSVAVGQPVRFTVDAFPGKTFEGTLSEVHYAPVEVQNVVTYTGIVEVENPDGALRPGMTANVEVVTSEKKGVLLIPNAALRVKVDVPDAGAAVPPDGKRTVWTLKDGKPVPVYVETGVTDFVNTEVVSGLSEGDTVVVEALGAGETSKRSGNTRRGGPMRFGH